VKSVRDKIALFSGSSEDVARLTTVSMTSMKSVSSADLRRTSIGQPRATPTLPPRVAQGRSQSLMDIQPARRTTSYHGQNAFPTLPRTISMEQQKRRNTVARIPEVASTDDREWIVASMAPAGFGRQTRAYAHVEAASMRPPPSTSPRGGGQQVDSKRRSLTERARTTPSPRPLAASPTTTSAFSVRTSISEFRAIEAGEKSQNGRPTSSIASMGKPASRSSSFTIAERKKSFENTMTGAAAAKALSTSRAGSFFGTSQDSLSGNRKISSKETLDNGSVITVIEAPIGNHNTSPTSMEPCVRSEADGGSRTSTPTKLANNNPSTPDRSTSVTPTTSVERSSNVSMEKNLARSTSIVSKDSGLPEEPPSPVPEEPASAVQPRKMPPLVADSRWSELERKYSSSNNNGDNNNSNVSSRKSSLASPSAAKSIKELTEKFEASSANSGPGWSSSASSSRRASLTTTATTTATMEQHEISFKIGERATLSSTSMNNFWLTGDSLAALGGGGAMTTMSNFLPEGSAEWESFDPAEPLLGGQQVLPPPTFADPVPAALASRKFSAPASNATGGEVRMRERGNVQPSRPSSMIEGQVVSQAASQHVEGHGGHMRAFEMGHLGGDRLLHSGSTSRGSSQADLLEASAGVSGTQTPASTASICFINSSSSTGNTPVKSPLMPARVAAKAATASQHVQDIRRAFEKAEQSLSSAMTSTAGGAASSAPGHHRMSSLDSTTSEESGCMLVASAPYGSVSSLLSGHAGSSNLKDHYGSISSLASSTSLISPQVSVVRRAY